jgi:hypothetical protein
LINLFIVNFNYDAKLNFFFFFFFFQTGVRQDCLFRLHFMKFMSNINNSSAQSTGLWLSSRMMGLPHLGLSTCPKLHFQMLIWRAQELLKIRFF